MSTAVSPDRILKQLGELWTGLGKQDHPETAAGVLRACTMTVLVATESSEDVSALGESLAELVQQHPARIILIRLTGPGERALSERVYAQCWMPFGQRRQICCEYVEITASDAALGDLPAVLDPLTAPDLPVVLWNRSPRVAALPDFAAVREIAGKFVVDSFGAPDARAAISSLAALASNHHILADLAWTRLTRWREMLAQVFENRTNLAALPGVRRLSVSYASGWESAARYFAAWVSSLLPENVQLSVAADASVQNLSLQLFGDPMDLTLTASDHRLVITVNGASHCTNLPDPADYLLMNEELRIMRRDPVFESTLARAARLNP